MKNENYEEFVNKFQIKHTTDDCNTPPIIYKAVKDWACKQYDIDQRKIVRPFYPGGDYENYDYEDDCVVLDNPPFSIIAAICNFYLERRINFFLFEPSMTAFSRCGAASLTHIFIDEQIVYENGARVATGFVTNLGGEVVAHSAPDLEKAIKDANLQLYGSKKKHLPKYTYPQNVLTAAMLRKYAKCGVEFKVKRDDCIIIDSLDEQKPLKKAIYGGGLLISDNIKSEKVKNDQLETREKHIFQLSEREKQLIREMNR